MSETKVTPGPSLYQALSNSIEIMEMALACANETDSEFIRAKIDDARLALANTNARLSAATPEMLQLLTESIDIMERQVDYSGELASILTRAKAVLAKINS